MTSETPDELPEAAQDDPLGEEIQLAQRAFAALVPLAPDDAALAGSAVAAVVCALSTARTADDPTPGMMQVPVLVGDPLARATLADAAPSAADALGDLECALLAMPAPRRAEAADRIRRAVRAADGRLGTAPGRAAF